jgi:hypothetical protein
MPRRRRWVRSRNSQGQASRSEFLGFHRRLREPRVRLASSGAGLSPLSTITEEQRDAPIWRDLLDLGIAASPSAIWGTPDVLPTWSRQLVCLQFFGPGRASRRLRLTCPRWTRCPPTSPPADPSTARRGGKAGADCRAPCRRWQIRRSRSGTATAIASAPTAIRRFPAVTGRDAHVARTGRAQIPGVLLS